MKTIIAGGRDYRMTEADFAWLDGLKPPITEVITGGARGADTGGEHWARSRGIPVVTVLADWKRLGRSAGPTRNRNMAAIAKRVALFPGGRGTESMRRAAKAAGLVIVEREDAMNETVGQIRAMIEPFIAPPGTPPEQTVRLVDALWPPTPDTPSDAPMA